MAECWATAIGLAGPDGTVESTQGSAISLVTVPDNMHAAAQLHEGLSLIKAGGRGQPTKDLETGKHPLSRLFV